MNKKNSVPFNSKFLNTIKAENLSNTLPKSLKTSSTITDDPILKELIEKQEKEIFRIYNEKIQRLIHFYEVELEDLDNEQKTLQDQVARRQGSLLNSNTLQERLFNEKLKFFHERDRLNHKFNFLLEQNQILEFKNTFLKKKISKIKNEKKLKTNPKYDTISEYHHPRKQQQVIKINLKPKDNTQQLKTINKNDIPKQKPKRKQKEKEKYKEKDKEKDKEKEKEKERHKQKEKEREKEKKKEKEKEKGNVKKKYKYKDKEIDQEKEKEKDKEKDQEIEKQTQQKSTTKGKTKKSNENGGLKHKTKKKSKPKKEKHKNPNLKNN
ncbi:chascon isoform d-related [Anaeramoeba flamelloides]|uniref:Chascon isoform d-related n=1 Tax=Anaeramoeba flamelloides TaxID=1746091 RepID=A0AAV7YVV9_9EUKA|nr:chascon isoform d-related [Anaeramoeba flamelloides]